MGSPDEVCWQKDGPDVIDWEKTTQEVNRRLGASYDCRYVRRIYHGPLRSKYVFNTLKQFLPKSVWSENMLQGTAAEAQHAPVGADVTLEGQK
jgi:hypothetical protein